MVVCCLIVGFGFGFVVCFECGVGLGLVVLIVCLFLCLFDIITRF